MTAFNAPIFHDEYKAREHLEAIRWPLGPLSEHGFRHDRRSALKINDSKRAEDALRMAAGERLMNFQSIAGSYA